MFPRLLSSLKKTLFLSFFAKKQKKRNKLEYFAFRVLYSTFVALFKIAVVVAAAAAVGVVVVVVAVVELHV